jgi:hypothetical protein
MPSPKPESESETEPEEPELEEPEPTLAPLYQRKRKAANDADKEHRDQPRPVNKTSFLICTKKPTVAEVAKKAKLASKKLEEGSPCLSQLPLY